jgi:hypothetical protein
MPAGLGHATSGTNQVMTSSEAAEWLVKTATEPAGFLTEAGGWATIRRAARFSSEEAARAAVPSDSISRATTVTVCQWTEHGSRDEGAVSPTAEDGDT